MEPGDDENNPPVNPEDDGEEEAAADEGEEEEAAVDEEEEEADGEEEGEEADGEEEGEEAAREEDSGDVINLTADVGGNGRVQDQTGYHGPTLDRLLSWGNSPLTALRGAELDITLLAAAGVNSDSLFIGDMDDFVNRHQNQPPPQEEGVMFEDPAQEDQEDDLDFGNDDNQEDPEILDPGPDQQVQQVGDDHQPMGGAAEDLDIEVDGEAVEGAIGFGLNEEIGMMDPDMPPHLVELDVDMVNPPPQPAEIDPIQGNVVTDLNPLSPPQPAVPMNPRPFLNGLVGRLVSVKLKWGQIYRGILRSTDSYMNLELLNCEEFISGVSHGIIGDILIRHNNVLYIGGE